MADKKDKKMVDFPEYDPDKRVPFPPGEGSPFGQAPPSRKKEQKQEKKPLYEDYDPDPPAPDPSQTTPGAPDIRDPETRVDDGELGKYSPDIDLKK